jgi:predicted flap endonuclease-1-like 5' DNA nuclease
LVGIGPKLAVSLADLGVTSFSQIAAWTPEDLTSIDQLLNLKGRADRDAWIAQAKRFAGATEA